MEHNPEIPKNTEKTPGDESMKSTFPFPGEGEDAAKVAYERAQEDKELERLMVESVKTAEGKTAEDTSTYDPVERLRSRRKQLKEELNAIDADLGEGRVDRTWLRKLPEWFWFPAEITFYMLSSQTAYKKSPGNPTVYHWQRHADLPSFGLNVFLGILYLSVILAVLSLIR